MEDKNALFKLMCWLGTPVKARLLIELYESDRELGEDWLVFKIREFLRSGTNKISIAVESLSLRRGELVDWSKKDRQVFYCLTPLGKEVCKELEVLVEGLAKEHPGLFSSIDECLGPYIRPVGWEARELVES